jgi:hypothetical protein
MRLTLTQYLDELTKVAERVCLNVQKHGTECHCTECETAWEVLEALQDNEPAELHHALGGE